MFNDGAGWPLCKWAATAARSISSAWMAMRSAIAHSRSRSRGSDMVHQQDAGLNESTRVLAANDLVPHRSNVTVISMEGREETVSVLVFDGLQQLCQLELRHAFASGDERL